MTMGEGNVFTGVCHSVYNFGREGRCLVRGGWVSGQEGVDGYLVTGGSSIFYHFSGGLPFSVKMGEPPPGIRPMRCRYAS